MPEVQGAIHLVEGATGSSLSILLSYSPVPVLNKLPCVRFLIQWFISFSTKKLNQQTKKFNPQNPLYRHPLINAASVSCLPPFSYCLTRVLTKSHLPVTSLLCLQTLITTYTHIYLLSSISTFGHKYEIKDFQYGWITKVLVFKLVAYHKIKWLKKTKIEDVPINPWPIF